MKASDTDLARRPPDLSTQIKRRVPLPFKRLRRLAQAAVEHWRTAGFVPYVKDYSVVTDAGRFEFKFLIADPTADSWYGQGDYALPYINFLLRHMRPDEILLECGAHHGLFTVLLAKHLTAGRVVAVEAHPRNAEILRENLRINGLNNVEVVQKAIAGRPGMTYIADRSSSCVLTAADWEQYWRIQVPAVTLDMIVKQVGVQPTYLKMDIEGAELEALQSAQQVLAAVPKLNIEVHLSAIHERYGSDADTLLQSMATERYDWYLQPTPDDAVTRIQTPVGFGDYSRVQLHAIPRA